MATSRTGTFQHTRRFLAYHGSRFDDQSVVVADDAGLLAALPAAVAPDDPAGVTSHPGAAYGGLLLAPRGSAGSAEEVLAAVCGALARRGFSRLGYKTVPPHLHSRVCQADIHAILRRGGRLVRRDLWNVIDLRLEPTIARRRREYVRAAERAGITVQQETSRDAYSVFLEILAERLGERHSVKPVHTLAEMLMLKDLFPDRIGLWSARDDGGAMVAGTWIFDLAPAAVHTQYIAATEAGERTRALDLLLWAGIERAAATGASYFSFGASTEPDDGALNRGLFDYKASFGAGSVAHDLYEIDLGGGA